MIANCRIAMDSISCVKAFAISIASFGALGTVTALWDNPIFFRMTPAGSIEILLLALQAVLLGLFLSINSVKCAGNQAGIGSIFTFLGVACPVCNKLLLFAFGSELLLVYFEPVRVYVAALGVLITAWALWRKLNALRGLETTSGPALRETTAIAMDASEDQVAQGQFDELRP